MMKEFPRKEIYVHTTPSLVDSKSVKAVWDREIRIPNYLKGYSQARWDVENKGWTSSRLPSAVDVESVEGMLEIHCGINEYKNLIGGVKLGYHLKRSDVAVLHGLSTEIMPLTFDGVFPLERRSATEHGNGFYDIPTSGQHAQMWLNKLEEAGYPDLAASMLDMTGFPKGNLLRTLGIKPTNNPIIYTGFSRGFEVSLDTQFNGFTRTSIECEELRDLSEKNKGLFYYKFEDLLKVLDSVGKNEGVFEDVYGNKPQANKQTGAFALVDDCLGTLLSNTYHLLGNGNGAYAEGVDVLRRRGYTVNEVPKGLIHLSSLQ